MAPSGPGPAPAGFTKGIEHGEHGSIKSSWLLVVAHRGRTSHTDLTVCKSPGSKVVLDREGRSTSIFS
jgi:hypothetical protein